MSETARPTLPGDSPRRVFDVVLVEPEIPNNTGNIGRTCVATGCSLHLIRPLGFDTSEKACRRAGLDYWPRLDVREHDSFDAYLRKCEPTGVWLFSTKGGRSFFDAEFRPGNALVFGKETAGLETSLLARFPERVVTMPMAPEERSLNVATAACAGVYEGLRQLLVRGEIGLDPNGRLTTGDRPRTMKPFEPRGTRSVDSCG
ncbi:tRNA (cytidine(34)-2'-O)-methyltransferase [Phycisphaerales bacterium]|nr:tRNA (cytidine(34)-2'-O)-methyltransferase [Phycisphaerales bacterium]